MIFKPRAYQKDVIEQLCSRQRLALFMFMGLGKTACVLTAIVKLIYDYLVVNKVLVVAPKTVAKVVWPDELEKWSHLWPLTWVVLHGATKEKDLELTHKRDITIINYDGLAWLEQHRRTLPHYDLLVLDESTFVKNQGSRRGAAARRLSKQIPRTVIMSGAPAPNSLLDLWHQMYILDQGQRLGQTEGFYKNRYFMQDMNQHSRWFLKRNAGRQIADTIKDIAIVLRADDLLDLPSIVNCDIPIRLTKEQRERYQTLEDQFFLDLSKDEKLVVFNAAALSMKLRQFISGFVYTETKPVRVHTEKLHRLKELLESLNGSPLLVAIQFHEEVSMIRDFLKRDVPTINSKTPDADRKEYIRQWNRGELPIMLMHPASGSHGLNLQFGGFNILYYSLTWSLDHYDQYIARLVRTGQKNEHVIVHRFIVRETIDEVILAVLSQKTKTQAELIDRIKAWGKLRQ